MFGIYEDIFVQHISVVIHFFWDLTTRNDLVPCVLGASYLWIYCIITDQVFWYAGFRDLI